MWYNKITRPKLSFDATTLSFMSIFKQKQKGYLGIDFGVGGIKIVQLQPAGSRGILFTYGFSERPPNEAGLDYLENIEATGALLKLICVKARATTTRAIAALPIPAVFSAVLSLASVPKKELLQAVQWEAKKLIPLPLEEVSLDFKVLVTPSFPPLHKGGKEGEGSLHKWGKESVKKEAIEVLLTAAPKSIIEKYIAIAKTAGLTLTSLETEAFAMIRSLLGSDLAPTVIIDIGVIRSNILIVDRGIPMLTRSVEVGGKKCTETIAQGLGIDLDKAESMKRDLGSTSPFEGPIGVLPELLRETLQPLFNELKYGINVYRGRNNAAGQEERALEKIILTGGGSGLPGLVQLFTQEFNLRTFIGEPWERVNYHTDLKPLFQSFGSRFSVAIGLALRNI